MMLEPWLLLLNRLEWMPGLLANTPGTTRATPATPTESAAAPSTHGRFNLADTILLLFRADSTLVVPEIRLGRCGSHFIHHEWISLFPSNSAIESRRVCTA